jgi:hypothetical protein
MGTESERVLDGVGVAGLAVRGDDCEQWVDLLSIAVGSARRVVLAVRSGSRHRQRGSTPRMKIRSLPQASRTGPCPAARAHGSNPRERPG